MSHLHYVMDLYFPEDNRSGRLWREVLRIVARSDEEALAECWRVDRWKKSHHYDLRAIRGTARSAHRLIYSSPAEALRVGQMLGTATYMIEGHGDATGGWAAD
jgi:hypothetical protein